MKIPFEKITSCGNNFVIIDETHGKYIPESKKNNFSKNVTNINFGIGSDGFIMLQPCTLKVLSDINAACSYWNCTPLQFDADYIFRMFEPNGAESLCCGNGLMCLAYYLYKVRGITFSRILTEIPNKTPVIRTMGYDKKKQKAWVNMGTPCRIPDFLFNSSDMVLYDNNIYKAHFDIDLNHIPGTSGINHIPDINHTPGINHIPGMGTSMKQKFSLTGYLIFTGEPHLIFLLGSKKYNNTLAANLCVHNGHMQHEYEINKNEDFSNCDLLYAIGKYFNNNLRDVFPFGININFINYMKGSNVIEQRCFERGIEKETLACGTGMVASAYLLNALNIIPDKQIHIYPVKCRMHMPDAQIMVEIRNGEYWLHGTPVRICTGMFLYSSPFLRNKDEITSQIYAPTCGTYSVLVP